MSRATPDHRPDPTEVEAILRGRHADPFAILGMHERDRGGPVVRVFAPEAGEVAVIDRKTGQPVATLDRIDAEGFFSGAAGRRSRAFPYRLRMRAGDAEWELDDPYSFGPLLGEFDEHLLAEGRHEELYRKLGAHPVTHEGVAGTAFAVWAPNARRVSVVGDFNAWDGRRHPMRRRHAAGVWELFIPGLRKGALYKYEILGVHGAVLPLKADPVAFAAEPPPATASVIAGLPEHAWQDADWMQALTDAVPVEAPISVYEAHLGSWRRGEGDRILSYDELAEALADYATDMGFTHVELLPVSEHPFTGSWGYQPIGMFAPTARHGTPADFARLVDQLHRAGLGVIVDWVPAHFPSDAHGLVRFDGTALYEHEDPRLGFHRDWNTLIYNFGRVEVANFLRASALYWLREFHVDALRVDAVASMLYLDYSREPGEWLPNRFGGRENLDAVDFLRRTNVTVSERAPGTLTIAEESTAWPGVSRPVGEDGLGFDFKWNMGWMHDTLEYMAQDPIHRKYHHDRMTFGLHYAFSENFILPLSHDEVVHGKGSLLGKMPGDRWQKFANLRAYFGFMWTHPGKKLLFMGGEFGQEREWNHDRSLDWHLLDDPAHAGVQNLVRDLNRLYRETPALHLRDCAPEGFEWIDGGDSENNVFSYLRKGDDGTPPVAVIANMAPVLREGFRIGLPCEGRWREVMNTDAAEYGGSGAGNGGHVIATAPGAHGRPAAATMTLPPLGVLVLVPEG
ncbi:1,4-alpha-glucan branching protein GlgB [Paracoccus stylophorae]|uniref:1,4-alpha-glucan branching enzyme GlgB n=1 Tax=Paracoccus stylophorae TaxID=659350 RepID=A0ABY7SWJ2_9RHOB|nr:1,4-alpha-glucan branching protein GlgB [Paracoccus stylophorae]WCR10838.1 1,4-alpha-glucan branching protein GlgB [Paracoccus stylophorae]